jgi:hypothetical protein
MREIDTILKDTLKCQGFKLKGTSWYRLTEDFINVINFQKSLYSNLYYVNIGIDKKIGNDNLYKPEYKFPIRFRIEELISDKAILQALDFERNFSVFDRLEYLNKIVNYSIDFLDSISNLEQLKLSLSDSQHPINEAAIIATMRSEIENR